MSVDETVVRCDFGELYFIVKFACSVPNVIKLHGSGCCTPGAFVVNRRLAGNAQLMKRLYC